MNKLSALCAISFAMILTSSVHAEDEYEYRDTPLSNQVDDLRDEDNDGVINVRDLCPGTPDSADIDNDGCSTMVKSTEQVQLRIMFPNDSAEINPVFQSQIKNMADFLAKYPTTSIELQGYASNVGKHDYNIELSERRANAVMDLLLSEGVPESRVTIVGYGDTILDSEGETAVSHAINRRVIASVVGYKGQVKKRWTIFTTKEK